MRKKRPPMHWVQPERTPAFWLAGTFLAGYCGHNAQAWTNRRDHVTCKKCIKRMRAWGHLLRPPR